MPNRLLDEHTHAGYDLLALITRAADQSEEALTVLDAAESGLLEVSERGITRGFAGIPEIVRDSFGTPVLDNSYPQQTEVVSAGTAYVVTSMMESVINEGTGYPNAQKPPFVLIGDSFASDSYWHGKLMNAQLEINGGMKGARGSWKDHVQIGMGGNTQPINRPQQNSNAPSGTSLMRRSLVASVNSARNSSCASSSVRAWTATFSKNQ